MFLINLLIKSNIILPFVLITALKFINSDTRYNFAGKQNPLIDLFYTQIPGKSMYVYEDFNKTMLIYTIYPDSMLKFTFKIYTNTSLLNDIFEKGQHGLILGFDFLFNSTDLSLSNYRADAFFCLISLKQGNITVFCHDYLYSFNEKKYFRNDGKNALGKRIISN